MRRRKAENWEKNPSLFFSAAVLLLVAVMLIWGVRHQIPTGALLCCILLLLYGGALVRGVPFQRMEASMLNGIRQGAGAMMILLLVGILIAMWMQSGLVPMIVFYGIGAMRADLMLPVTFLLCAALSLCTGSSWSACGTIGIACAGIGESLGIPVYMIAGAAIAGATVGDKISPFSDTTVFAASITGVNIYRHIRSMLCTTVPTFVLSLILYWIIGVFGNTEQTSGADLQAVRTALALEFRFHPVLLIIPASVLILSVLKAPALLSLLTSALLGGICSCWIQGVPVTEVIRQIYSGYQSHTGMAMIDEMLSKGGLVSMLPTIGIIILALTVGGAVSELKLLNTLMDALKRKAKTDQGIALLTLLCGTLSVLLLSSLYVSAILVKELFYSVYVERDIALSALSRTIEESTTVTTPLIPWHSSCIYYMGLFQLHSMAFAPYAIFCWLNLLVSIVLTKSGALRSNFHPDPDQKGENPTRSRVGQT